MDRTISLLHSSKCTANGWTGNILLVFSLFLCNFNKYKHVNLAGPGKTLIKSELISDLTRKVCRTVIKFPLNLNNIFLFLKVDSLIWYVDMAVNTIELCHKKYQKNKGKLTENECN